MALNPQYTGIPRFETVKITLANANRDGTGNIETLITGQGDIGTLVNSIIIKAEGITTNGMVRIFKKTGSGSWNLLDEIPVTATTPSATVQSFKSVYELNLILPSGYSIGVSTHNAETFVVHALGGDF